MTKQPEGSPSAGKPTCPERIRVTVNGEERRLPAGTTVADFLAESNVPARFIAVAVNREVVRRQDHVGVVLRDGDTVEIVRMVGGGAPARMPGERNRSGESECW